MTFEILLVMNGLWFYFRLLGANVTSVSKFCKKLEIDSHQEKWNGMGVHFNPFPANAPFLYPLKTLKNRKVF